MGGWSGPSRREEHVDSGEGTPQMARLPLYLPNPYPDWEGLPSPAQDLSAPLRPCAPPVCRLGGLSGARSSLLTMVPML